MAHDIIEQLRKRIWDTDVNKLSKPQGILIKVIRAAYLIGQDAASGHLTMWAMSLVYTTLLSLVPFLAVTFSVLKAFGVQREIESALYGFLLTPLGQENALKISDWIVSFVDNMKVGVLGSLGLAMLIYTAVSLIQKIENAFNAVWKVQKARSLTRRFSDYMSVILVGPVLIYAALGMTATMKSAAIVQKIESIEVFGTLINVAFRLSPYVFVLIAFTFVYYFIPNTTVRFRSALVGGVVAGLTWQTAGWIFATFVVSSTQHNAIYSSFAILFVFIIWMNISWTILLVGGKITFYHQNPQFLCIREEKLLLSNRQKEKFAFFIMYLIAYHYYHSKQPWTVESLVRYTGIPPEAVIQIITMLQLKGYLVEIGSEPPAYLPTRDLETISLKDLLNSVRTAEEQSLIHNVSKGHLQDVVKLIENIDNTVTDALSNQTLKSLVLASTGENA